MKKLIGLLAILMFSMSLLGQNTLGDGASNLLTFPAIIESKSLGHTDYPYESIYSFRENNKLYVLSYDTSKSYHNAYLQIKERKLNIYRLDSDGWKVASDLIKTDFWDGKSGKYDYYSINDSARIGGNDFNGFIKGFSGYSYVKKLGDGKIEMKILFFYGVDGDSDYRWTYYWKTFLLIPNGDETYMVK